MGKIVVECKKGKITIINKLSYPETVNERVYNAIASGTFEGFLPVSIREKRKETHLVCVVHGLIPLNQYLNGIVTKKIFLDLVQDIAQYIKNCEINLLNANNLELQSDKIFIDPQSKTVKCIFWPIVNNQRGNPPQYFLKQLPYELNFDPREDDEYLERYKTFFGGVNAFSVNGFERLIFKLQGVQINSGYLTPTGSLSGSISNEKENNKKVKKVAIEYDPLECFSSKSDVSVVIERSNRKAHKESDYGVGERKNNTDSNISRESGGNLALAVRTTSPSEQVRIKTENRSDGSSAATAVLCGEVNKKAVSPFLIRERTGERYAINKTIFRIGSGQDNCDLYVDNNKYISRNHAEIITKGKRCYIVDNNSKNKTYIDGKVLPEGKEIEIFPGTKIQLANENFIFSLRKL